MALIIPSFGRASTTFRHFLLCNATPRCQVIFNSSVFVLPDVSYSVLIPVDGHKRQPSM